MKSLLKKRLEMVVAQVMNNLLEVISVIPMVKVAVKTVMMTAKRRKGTAASTSRSSKNSHSSVDRSQCEESVGSEGEGSESDESAVAKSQPLQNAVSNAYSGRDGTLWYKSVPQVGRANAANVLQQAPGLPLQSR